MLVNLDATGDLSSEGHRVRRKQNSRRGWALHATVAVAAATALGCGRNHSNEAAHSPQNRPNILGCLTDIARGVVGWYTPRDSAGDRVLVWGTVSRKGRLLSSGQVTLFPTRSSGTTASGLIAEDGTYVLYGGTSGIPGVDPGTYTAQLTQDPSRPTHPGRVLPVAAAIPTSLSIEIKPKPHRLDLKFP